MKYIYLLAYALCPFLLCAQTLDGAFSCQGKEVLTGGTSISVTSITGQSFEGIEAGASLAYGFIERVSTENEYTDVLALTLSREEASLAVGEEIELTAIFSPEVVDNPAVSWFSSDPKVATIKDGTVSAKSRGTVVVTVVSAYGVYADECNITVTQSESEPIPVTGVVLEPEEVMLEIGRTLELEATVLPQDADDKRVEWSSSDERVATVLDGVVTAMGVGTATISVTTVDGGYEAACMVPVDDDPTSIENVSEGNSVFFVDGSLHLDLQKPQTVYILDVSGKVCDVIQCQSGQSTVSMQKYSVGIYFVRMDNQVVKVVKR